MMWYPQVEAPVLQNLPRLPAPLGTLVYTDQYFTRLPVSDRLTALPLLPALLTYDSDAATYADFDRVTARQLLRGTPVRLPCACGESTNYALFNTLM
eukprot:4919592-Pyramimonas_sp.AAC.1